MKKQIITLATSVVLCSSASAQLAPLDDELKEVCYDLTPTRFAIDREDSTAVFGGFTGTSTDPGAPVIDFSDVTFGLTFDGAPPTQAILPSPSFGFTWDPAVTTNVALTGLIGIPEPEGTELKHICYDFSFEFSDETSERLDISVISLDTGREITANERGVFEQVTGEVSIVTNVISADGTVVRDTVEGSSITAVFSNVQACYCVVPEPSSVALLGLGGLALIARRRRS